MAHLSLVSALVVAGILFWLVNTYVPMGEKSKSLTSVIAVIFVVFWLLYAFGVFGGMDFRVPRMGI